MGNNMQCNCEKQSITRTTAYHNKGKGKTFCCFNCDSWFFSHRPTASKHKKLKKMRRVKPAHRDWQD
jgi:hypothetical protein